MLSSRRTIVAPWGVRLSIRQTLDPQLSVTIIDSVGIAIPDLLNHPPVPFPTARRRPGVCLWFDEQQQKEQSIEFCRTMKGRARPDVPPCGREVRGRLFLLYLEWDPPVHSALEFVARPPSSGTLRDAGRVADAVMSMAALDDTSCSELAVATLTTRLKNLALTDRAFAIGELIERTDPQLIQMMRGFDHIMSADVLPLFSVDPTLATGMTRSSLYRTISRFCNHYDVVRGTWRELRDQWRQTIAMLLLTNGAATTTRVARIVGFAGPSSLCHSFANAGLPAPRTASGHARKEYSARTGPRPAPTEEHHANRRDQSARWTV